MAAIEKVHSNGFLQRAHLIFAYLGGLYLLAILALMIPVIQSHILYMHWLKYPFWSKYHLPERYGLAPGKTLNFHIQTSDNITLGAWFVLSDTYYRTTPFPPPPSHTPSLQSDIPQALKTHPTVLFFHGNAATRVAPYRVQYYQSMTTRLNANVLVIDYRGFGDSEGTPTEDGLALDARAAWDWLITHGADPKDVLIMGHSLGTSVTARLSAELAKEGVEFKGMVLMSPFSSVKKLLETYMFLGFIPLMKPLHLIPGAAERVLKMLLHTYEGLQVITTTKVPTLLIHAQNDWDIPSTHSLALFSSALEPHLPAIPTAPSAPSLWTQNQWDAFYKSQQERKIAYENLVTNQEIKNFGNVQSFERSGEHGGKVVFLETIEGGHNMIGTHEGVYEVIRSIFGFS